ncbi:hypothetical protein [Paenarthrobacter ureafaciens]|uniref:hypothetical protein n=1 Tax=Paenarthrobacter ureafaciens TaxID=37931 RepID=UPI002DBA0BE9|nr:hypothetical protein [Paenarthrobacter ureafaciens]MEC3853739.1 hypothetical protein [Paenarthrobacter ureafaciens]
MSRVIQTLRFSGWVLVVAGLVLLATGVLSTLWASVWALGIAALSVTEWILRDREEVRRNGLAD